MNQPAERPLSPDHELVVAYLDAELTPQAAAEVEQRLSRDEAFRQLMQSMRDAWELLDELPQATLDERFTRTTVEMVALDLSTVQQQADRKHVSHTQWRSLRRWAGVVACFALGFLMLRSWQAANERRLVSDLPVIERVDQYQQVDSLEFLELLAASDVFDADIDQEASDELP